VGDVGLFARAPRRLGEGASVGAAVDDRGDVLTKAASNLLTRRGPTLIFHRVVEQCRDGFVLVPAVFEDEPGHAEQVRDVGDGRALAVLPGVEPRGVDESFFEARG
jgi:hypothetical protein